MNVLVVDDEPMARRILLNFLNKDSAVKSIRECETGEAARELLAECRFDIVFLDIHMPGIDGFEALGGARDSESPIIIFVTAYEQYALKAIESGATDYLLKPFDEERFSLALSRAKKRFLGEALVRKGGELAALLNAAGQGPLLAYAQKISIPDGSSVQLVDVTDILWIDASDKYVLLHKMKTTVRARMSLAEIESKLDPHKFLRVHRSCIVALHTIASLDTTPGGASYLELDNGARVPVSRSRLPTIRARLR